jgi:uncharacterized protein YndB with AHSA1/START domain
VTEPLQLSFRVACPPEHAFEIWTARASLWWPADHSVSGEDGLDVVIEPHVGGRIFERTRAGREEDWGEVLVWEPPRRLVYLWHLRADRADATEVEVVFAPDGEAATEVRIDHRGWERLGGRAGAWRDRNRRGWTTLIPWYVEFIEGGDGDG